MSAFAFKLVTVSTSLISPTKAAATLRAFLFTLTSEALDFTDHGGLGAGLIGHYAAAPRLKESDVTWQRVCTAVETDSWQKKAFASAFRRALSCREDAPQSATSLKAADQRRLP